VSPTLTKLQKEKNEFFANYVRKNFFEKD